MMNSAWRHFAIVAALLAPFAASSQTTITTDNLIARLRAGTAEGGYLWLIRCQPNDPRTVPALKAALERQQGKAQGQEIAVTLIELGEQAPEYFDLLAGYAQTAVGDRAPFAGAHDAKGLMVRGELSSEFKGARGGRGTT
jgi:hypothetical protein